MQKMSEKEAKDIIYILAMSRAEEGDEEDCEALDIAMNSIEEIQQYRAIGTVKELARLRSDYERVLKYNDDQGKIIDRYEAIGTLDQCREAVERMKPKKPIIQKRGVYDDDSGDWLRDEEWYMCPTCQMRREVYPTWKVCHYCGQALDRSE